VPPQAYGYLGRPWGVSTGYRPVLIS